MDYGLIGEHLGHSYSPEIHKNIGDYSYVLKELKPEEVIPFLKERDFKAINVTIPYKQTVIPCLDEISESAAAIGAVNTIVNKDGKLYGYNTDFDGMKAALKKGAIDPAHKKVLILGTGGTSRTANAVALSLGAETIYKVSRTEGPGVLTYEQATRDHKDTEIIINTTPAGMYPNVDSCPIDINEFPALEGVMDVIYNPLQTLLIKAAKEKAI
ncbi:MAG: shikimate dehydrogenase, partial [Parasporobacterium sp.]|nr:shikimate dehydrogenase [Parasporobacterium sp.]